jgi:hypothetical protein
MELMGSEEAIEGVNSLAIGLVPSMESLLKSIEEVDGQLRVPHLLFKTPYRSRRPPVLQYC